MLVLSRKAGERVLVGDNVIVTVVRIGPNAVRLGIEAPKDSNIVREELVAVHGKNIGNKIQADESDIEDLGQRVHDPLGVAEAYDSEIESEMIDHGVGVRTIDRSARQ